MNGPGRAACLILCAFLLFSGGCAIMRAPELHVIAASWDEESAVDEERPARVLRFDVTATNPHMRQRIGDGAPATDRRGGGAVRLIEVQYEVLLDGRTVYHGRRDARATLAPGGERAMTLPAVIIDGKNAADYQIRGRMHYLTADRLAEILADLGLPYRSTRFAATGRVE